MRKTLLALTLGLFSSAALAAGEYDAQHEDMSDVEVDCNIKVEAGDMWFDPEELDQASEPDA